MNIIKLTEGLKDTTEGLQGCAVLARPMISELKSHKLQLEEENAKPIKKWGFLFGFAALNILENWKYYRKDIFEIKDGVVEIIQAVKEPGLTDEQFKKEKEKIEDKQRVRCEALPPKKVESIPAPVQNPEPAVVNQPQVTQVDLGNQTTV